METFSALLALCAGNSPVTGEFPWQRPGLDVFLICAWINGWVNNREAGDWRRHRAHYDVTVMEMEEPSLWLPNIPIQWIIPPFMKSPDDWDSTDYFCTTSFFIYACYGWIARPNKMTFYICNAGSLYGNNSVSFILLKIFHRFSSFVLLFWYSKTIYIPAYNGDKWTTFQYLWGCTVHLTHLPLYKMTAISQTIFLDVFLWMKSFVFWLKFQAEVCSLGSNW